MLIYFGLQTQSISYVLHNLSLVSYFHWVPESPDFGYVKRVNASPSVWTLFYEMFFYVVFSLSKTLINNKKATVAISSVIMLITLGYFTYSYGNNGKLGWVDVSYINMFSNLSLLSFIAGMLFNFINVPYRDKTPALFVYLIPIFSLVTLKKADNLVPSLFINEQISDLVFSSIPSWIFVGVLIKRKTITGFISEKLYYLGMISFSLYLVHCNFYILKDSLSVENKTFTIQIAYFFVAFIISLIIAKWSYKHIETSKRFKVSRKVA